MGGRIMYCEDCGGVMDWRCTNQITNVSKFKCRNCGHIQTGELKLKPVNDEKKEPKFYCLNNHGSWIVKKRKNNERLYAGAYSDEETAKKVVAEMVKCDWDLDMLPVIRTRLNIHRVGRSWVCA